jgi:LAO/AO transport system kinase
VVTVLDAMGYDMILIETVGVGQAEVEVVETAHLAVVVVVPGLGDEVQAIKAGILEIADILCLNKADHPQADRAEDDLHGMLELRGAKARKPPIVRTVAVNGSGVAELAQAIRSEALVETGAVRRDRLLHRTRRHLIELVREQALAQVLARDAPLIDDLVQRVANRELDPYSAVDLLLCR